MSGPSTLRLSAVIEVKQLAQAVRRAFDKEPIPTLYVGKYANKTMRWTS